jgi:putative nucleotidyltransferase with HDIG domain
LKALAATIDAKDPYTRGHSERVTEYAQHAARATPGITERDLEHLKYGAILHDIGKIGVDERILRKPGPLTRREKAVMDGHPATGASIVEGVAFLKEALPIIRHHHEHYDGQGYPAGLRGDEIPLGARILAVADSYDAMTTLRPYRPPMSQEQALQELRRCSGTQFDPATTAAFVEWMRTPRET